VPAERCRAGGEELVPGVVPERFQLSKARASLRAGAKRMVNTL